MNQNQKHEKNWLEWIVFALGMALTLLVLGYLGYQAITASQATPILMVSADSAQEQDGQYVMPVRVRNTSAAPAEGVHVQVVLFKDGAEWEKADFTLQFAPPHSRRRGWVSFLKDPSQADRIEARALGYQMP